MTPAHALRDAARRYFGHAVADSDLHRLDQLLADAISEGIAPDAPTLIARLATPGAERRWFATALTVDESYFFRNLGHFQALTQAVLPAVLAQKPGGQPIRVLSAGCSRGQEAYTIAMVLTHALRDVPDASIAILGIDVNPRNIEAARAGRYTPWSLRSPVDPPYDRWIHRIDGEIVVDDAIRAMVEFEERNLIAEDESFWREEAFDIVFFRNVAIYLAPEVLAAVAARLARALAPAGFLFLSESETLRGASDAFRLRSHGDAFFYQVGAPDPIATFRSYAPPRNKAITPSAARARHAVASPARKATPPTAADRGTVLALARQERFRELAALPQPAADPLVGVAVAVGKMSTGDRAGASALCRKVLDVYPGAAEAHHVLALCDESGPAAVLAHDQAALELDPTFATARLHLGLAYRRGGRPDLARAELVQASESLVTENDLRIALFGGGLDRNALIRLATTAIASCGGPR